MNQMMQSTIERRRIRSLIEHGQVARVEPVRSRPELILNLTVERGTGKRVRNGDANVVRMAVTHQLNCQLDIVEGLAKVAKLKEETDSDPGPLQPPCRLANLLDPRSFFHSVEDALGTRFGADPDRIRAKANQRGDGVRLEQHIRSLQALEGNAQMPRL